MHILKNSSSLIVFLRVIIPVIFFSGFLVLAVASFWQIWVLELIISWIVWLFPPLFLLMVGYNIFLTKGDVSPLAALTVPLIVVIALTQMPVRAVAERTVNESDFTGSFVLESHNLYVNASPEAVEGHVEHSKQIDAEIIVLQEADPAIVEAYKEAMGFEFSVTSDCSCSAGQEIAVISKHFLFNPSFEYFGSGGFIELTVSVNREVDVTLFAVHTDAPVSPGSYRNRNQNLKLLTERVASAPGTVVAAGDFNATNWSPSMRGFSDGVGAKVQTARTDWIPEGTFCTRFKGCIAIDHVYVDRSLTHRGLEVGPENGSDHSSVFTSIYY